MKNRTEMTALFSFAKSRKTALVKGQKQVRKKSLSELFYLHTKSHAFFGLPTLRISGHPIFCHLHCSYFLLLKLFSITFLSVIVLFDRLLVFRLFNNTFFRCKRPIFRHFGPVCDRRFEHRNERRNLHSSELSERLVVDGWEG